MNDDAKDATGGGNRQRDRTKEHRAENDRFHASSIGQLPGKN
jgi:hypothetical protein